MMSGKVMVRPGFGPLNDSVSVNPLIQDPEIIEILYFCIV
jgi:hypothetical protein